MGTPTVRGPWPMALGPKVCKSICSACNQPTIKRITRKMSRRILANEPTGLNPADADNQWGQTKYSTHLANTYKSIWICENVNLNDCVGGRARVSETEETVGDTEIAIIAAIRTLVLIDFSFLLLLLSFMAYFTECFSCIDSYFFRLCCPLSFAFSFSSHRLFLPQ